MVARAQLHVVVLCASMILSGCTVLRTADTALPAPFADALQQHGIAPSSVALVVQSVEGGTAQVITHNAQQAFQPASVMKLLTSAAALQLLGPDYRWITRVHMTGALQGDVLYGDLIIEGSGDPRFAHEDLGRLLRMLRQQGVREIRGDLLLDRSLFQPQMQDAAAFDGQPSRAYNALPDALLLDAHALTVRFRLSNTSDISNTSDASDTSDALGAAGAQVQIISEPPLAGFSITPAALSDQPCQHVREQLQPRLSAQGLHFAGAYPAACGERELTFHLHTLDAVQYVDAVFRALWQELGGSLSGQVRAARVPADSRELLAWPSRPLAQVLADINKQSNNVMSRNLMLSLVAQRGGEPATATAASARVLSWMAENGLPTGGVVIDNGSGLSRAERLPAATLAAVLQHAWQQPTMPELLASLPVAGVDGTLARRQAASPVRGRAHIKTGSLAGVASIAGYVSARSGRRVIVVCLINHANANNARASFDVLLDWVYANY